jgi:hypothetical protein
MQILVSLSVLSYCLEGANDRLRFAVQLFTKDPDPALVQEKVKALEVRIDPSLNLSTFCIVHFCFPYCCYPAIATANLKGGAPAMTGVHFLCKYGGKMIADTCLLQHNRRRS